MSDDFHRPTLTFPSGAYNATQVRLYGIRPAVGNTGIVSEDRQLNLASKFDDLFVSIKVSESDPRHEDDKPVPQKGKSAARNESNPPPEEEFLLRLEASRRRKDIEKLAYYSQITMDMKQMCSVAISAAITLEQAVSQKRVISTGIIVGYAFEGHTYDLPKPKIMIIPTLPQEIPLDDSGYDKKVTRDAAGNVDAMRDAGYAVWLVDKLDECIEFEMNQGFVEQLILEANTPGKRAPNMYVGRMMMGHRSGRLTE